MIEPSGRLARRGARFDGSKVPGARGPPARDEQWAVEDEAFYSDPETRAWLETLVDAIVVKSAGRSRWIPVGQRATIAWREGLRDAREGVVERRPRRRSA